ncbi:MAG: circadian clock protein KaiC [bacterium]
MTKRGKPARRAPEGGPVKAGTLKPLAKCPTGIRGLDDVTEGGLPRGRPTLICGGAGCGKTLMAMEFIVRGARDFGEPGVFMAFEETVAELASNVASLGFDLPSLIRRKKLAVDYVRVERSEIEETGEYDLEGLFLRLGSMIDEVHAKRVALDTIESLFSSLPNEGILRAELRRLFRWLKERGVTAVITAERGQEGQLTRYGLEEYVSDCVIVLDHRVSNQVATRRLRVVKYRGSAHGTNEYPTMIDEHGLSVLPITSLGLCHRVSDRRVSTGIPRLDTMMTGKGYWQGSSVLISGTAGAGKTSIATAFMDGVCRRGGRCLYYSFEESPDQIVRNMGSIGFRLGPYIRDGRLRFHSVRPTLYGLESHLVTLHGLVARWRPDAVVMDPITGLTSIGEPGEVKSMLMRVVDFLKSRGITTLFTSLTEGGAALDKTDISISSLMDTWLLLQMVESAGERNRVLYVLKSRGMAHSNQLREFMLTDDGIKLMDVYTGGGVVRTGSARAIQESLDKAAAVAAAQASRRRQQEITHEQSALEAEVRTLQSRLAGLKQEMATDARQERARGAVARRDTKGRARVRTADRDREGDAA